MESGASAPSAVTVVYHTPAERALVWIVFPLVGAGAARLLKAAAGWVAALPWAPFQGPFKLVASIPEPQSTIGSLAIGIVAGLVLVYFAENEYVTVTVDDSQATIASGGSSQDVQRAAIDAVFLDGKQLVLLGHATEELARVGGDLPAANRLEAAFLAHGYPWRADGDPYKDDYRRWIPEAPDLSAAAHAVFKARDRALQRGDKEDVAQLRVELAKLGIVVRDESKRQFWRPVPRT